MSIEGHDDFLAGLVSGEEQFIENNGGIVNLDDLNNDFKEVEEVAETTEETETIEPTEEEVLVESEETEEPTTNTEEEAVSEFGSFMNNFASKGILYANPEKEYEDSEEGFTEMINDTIQDRLNKEFIQNPEMDSDISRALSYIMKNKSEATIEGLVEMFNNTDYNNASIDNETHQNYLIEDDMKARGFSEEKIQAAIKAYDAAGMKREQAEIAKQSLIKRQEDNIREREEANRKLEEMNELKRQKDIDAYRSSIIKKSSIGGMEVSPEERVKLADYMLKPVRDGKPQIMIDEDNESDLLYAYIKMNKISLKSLKREAETKSVVNFKKKVDNYTDKNSKVKSTQGPREFNDGDLSGLDSWKL